MEEGIVFDEPTIEFSYKNDDLHDPLINAYHAIALKLATREEIETIKTMAFRVNEVLTEYFRSTAACDLVDFKLEFGRPGRRHASSSPTRSPPTPAASGTARRTRSSTRTASAATWAAWRTPTSEMMHRVFGE